MGGRGVVMHEDAGPVPGEEREEEEGPVEEPAEIPPSYDSIRRDT